MNQNEYRSKLKSKRKEMKYTQQQVADKLGISRSYYSDIENKKKMPNGSIVFKLNEVLPLFKEI